MRLGRRLRELFARATRDEGFFEDLEDALVEGDLGGRLAARVSEELRELVASGARADRESMLGLLEGHLRTMVRVAIPEMARDSLNLILVLGVNGVGKTTTIAKLARRLGAEVEGETILGAADTFRAAAVEQIEIWGERLGCRVVSQEAGADPGAVVYDSITAAKSRNAGLLIIDTAGRLHNKTELVRELGKLDKIISSRCPDNGYHKLLVIDATTGQNAMRQAEVFNEAIGVDSCVLAKYDSTARGGVVVAICDQLGLPFSYLGTGEGPDDLAPFEADAFVRALVRGGGQEG